MKLYTFKYKRPSKLLVLLMALCLTPVSAMKLVDRLIPYNETGVAGPDDYFAEVMAVDGDTLVVGAPGTEIDIGGYYNNGVAYVYERNGQNWQLAATLKHPDGAWNYSPQFAAAVEVSGNHIFVTMDLGRVAVYKNTATHWQLASIISYVTNGSNGMRIKSDGGTLMIRTTSGVQVFKHDVNSDNWNYLSTITYPDPQIDGYFGYDIAIENDLAVIGTYGHSDNPYSYIYRRTGDDWLLEYRLPEPLQVAVRESVDISNGRAIIHAESGPSIYEYQAGNWQLTEILPSINICNSCIIWEVLIEMNQAAYMVLDYFSLDVQFQVFNFQNNAWNHFDSVIPNETGFATGTSVLTADGIYLGLYERFFGNQDLTHGRLEFHEQGTNDFQLGASIQPPRGTPQEEIGNVLLTAGDTAFTNGPSGLFEFTQVAGQWLYSGMVTINSWLTQFDGGVMMVRSFPDVLSTYTKINKEWALTGTPISGVSEQYQLKLPYLLVNPTDSSQFDLYHWSNNDWVFQSSMTLNGITGSGHQFNISIANDHALIGVSDANQAFLLNLVTGNEVDQVTATNGTSSFGYHVALNGSQAVVAGCSSNSIHSYELVGDKLNFLTVLDQVPNYIGCMQQLLMNDQYLAFRTHFQSNGSAPNYHNYEVYHQAGNSWDLQSRLQLIRNYWTDSQSNITLNDDQLSISMPHDDDRGYDSGTVFVYDVSFSDLIIAHDFEP